MTSPVLDYRNANPIVAPKYGLLSSASVVDLGALRWGNGVQWLPELHPSTSLGYGARELQCQPAAIAHGSGDRAHLEQARPFLIYAYDWSTALDRNGRDWMGRAKRLLNATQGLSIAKEVWNGTISTAKTLGNTHLAKTGVNVVTVGAVAAYKALAKLDKEIASKLANGRGMIHCSVETLNRLVQAYAIIQDGSQWVTAFGNLVVADGGYSGDRDGQSTTEEWMIATSIMQITLGETLVTPFNATDIGVEAVDRTVNDVIIWAQREALVMHEPNLVWAAAQVDLT